MLYMFIYDIKFLTYSLIPNFIAFLKFISLAEGKPIPTELRNEEAALRHEIDLEDQNTAGSFFKHFFNFLLGNGEI